MNDPEVVLTTAEAEWAVFFLSRVVVRGDDETEALVSLIDHLRKKSRRTSPTLPTGKF